MKVEYISHMGGDLTVANAARVSFNKQKEEFDDSDNKGSDRRLLQYLAEHNHWTPFGHPQISLRITTPVPIRTQCFKHKVGFIENEVSRRYTDEDIEFYMPDGWRGKPVNGAKQGSSEELIKTVRMPWEVEVDVDKEVEEHYAYSLQLFNAMVKGGICVEQARFVLPQGMMVKWIWTGSLAAYCRFLCLRKDSHAQKEIQELAGMVDEIIRPLFPVSVHFLVDKRS